MPVYRELTVPPEKAPANSVPAAAVIRMVQALSGITRRKAYVGVFVSRLLNPSAQRENVNRNYKN